MTAEVKGTTKMSALGGAVDWGVAASVGAKLTRPAPPVSDYTLTNAIAELESASRSAEVPVREVTGLTEGGGIPDARVVDRADWVRLACDSMRAMTGAGSSIGEQGSAKAGVLTGKVAGAQTGAVLAFVSSGILGQYDPFTANGGQLLLVCSNVIAVERRLRVQPSDFRMWVCLHEVTHRVQFRANPWLSGYMSDTLGALTDDAGEDVTKIIGRLAEFVRNRRAGVDPRPNGAGIVGLLKAVQSEQASAALDRLLVLGTLLEGHADHVMDAVGPAVVPSVSTIRRRFDERRQRKQPPVQRLLRALLGIDAKISQYTRGKAFVDDVVRQVGMQRFNAVWSGPATLPLPNEIEDPRRWIDRVL